MNHLFSMANKWKYGLAAVAVPSTLGVFAWLARVVGLTSGCATDARMGGVGMINTLLSIFCHPYLQGKKQAEERRQAIPEVNLRMNFLQQVDHDVKEMRKSKTIEDNESIKIEEEDEGKESEAEDKGKKPKGLF